MPPRTPGCAGESVFQCRCTAGGMRDEPFSVLPNTRECAGARELASFFLAVAHSGLRGRIPEFKYSRRPPAVCESYVRRAGAHGAATQSRECGGGGCLRATAHPRVCGRAVFQRSRTPRGVRKSMFERRLRQGGAWEGPLGVPPQTLGCVPAPCECSRRPLLTATGGDRESTITFHRASLVMWQS